MSHVLYSRGKQLVLTRAIAGASLWLFAIAGPAVGFEEIKDSGASADGFVEVIAQSREATPIVDRMIELSRDKLTRADLDTVAGPLNTILAKATLPGHKDRLAEKQYGNTISVYWYRVIYRGTADDQFISIYIKLTFMRAIDYLQLTDFNFNTDVEKIGLP